MESTRAINSLLTESEQAKNGTNIKKSRSHFMIGIFASMKHNFILFFQSRFLILCDKTKFNTIRSSGKFYKKNQSKIAIFQFDNLFYLNLRQQSRL